MEYIIVDSNNNWLATESSKEDAIETATSIQKNYISGQYYGADDMELGETLYLYESKEISQFNLE